LSSDAGTLTSSYDLRDPPGGAVFAFAICAALAVSPKLLRGKSQSSLRCLSSRRLYHQSADPRGGNIFSSLAARNEYMPHLSPQDLTLSKQIRSVVVVAARSSAAAENVVKRACRTSDAGSDSCASADVGMRRRADAGTCRSAQRSPSQGSQPPAFNAANDTPKIAARMCLLKSMVIAHLVTYKGKATNLVPVIKHVRSTIGQKF
jgi:hypothetical protein